MKKIDAAATEFLANTRIAVTSVSRHSKSHGSMTTQVRSARLPSPPTAGTSSAAISHGTAWVSEVAMRCCYAHLPRRDDSGSPGLLGCGDRRVCTTSPTVLERSWKAKGAIGGEWARYLQIVI
jgi:hypothetical protein